ncbi:MAG: hypothetical protein ACPG1Z_10550 [Planctomycetota bacterium]
MGKMLDSKKIIRIQLELHYGDKQLGKKLLVEWVNTALDAGEWHEHFDLAVGAVNDDDAAMQTLLESVLKARPEAALDFDLLDHGFFEKRWEASRLRFWLMDDLALISCNNYAVIKFENSRVVWVTKQVSWDGIQINGVEDGLLLGEWSDKFDATQRWKPLKINYETGAVVERGR